MLDKHKQQAINYAWELWKKGEKTFDEYMEVFNLVNSK